jgi:hypothetical protein
MVGLLADDGGEAVTMDKQAPNFSETVVGSVQGCPEKNGPGSVTVANPEVGELTSSPQATTKAGLNRGGGRQEADGLAAPQPRI